MKKISLCWRLFCTLVHKDAFQSHNELHISNFCNTQNVQFWPSVLRRKNFQSSSSEKKSWKLRVWSNNTALGWSDNFTRHAGHWTFCNFARFSKWWWAAMLCDAPSFFQFDTPKKNHNFGSKLSWIVVSTRRLIWGDFPSGLWDQISIC